MQLTFLQEDLLHAMQSQKPTLPKKSKKQPAPSLLPVAARPPAAPMLMPMAAKKPPTAAPVTAKAKPVEPEEPPVAAEEISHPDDEKAPSAFKTISEVASFLSVPQHVLRFWESRFSQIKPLKLRGGRRYYRPEDIEVLSKIQNLLYKQGYTIKGAKKAFNKEAGASVDKASLSHKLSALPALPAAKVKTALSEKQLGQIAGIRNELIGLKAVLTPYLEH
jgi:DNA-binding transcriptional MerR regulator